MKVIKVSASQLTRLIQEGKLSQNLFEEDMLDLEPTDDSEENADDSENNEPEETEQSFEDEVKSIPGGKVADFLMNFPKSAKGQFGYVYYTAPLNSNSINKFYVDDDGVKKPNPYWDKLYRNTVIKFQIGKTYSRAVELKNQRTGDDYEIGAAKKGYERVKGSDVLQTGKSGYYFSVVFENWDDTANNLMVFENGKFTPIDKDAVKKYLKPHSGSDQFINYRNLITKNIYQIRAGGRIFDNPEFPYQYLGPKNLQK
jgi:hypothetical protein